MAKRRWAPAALLLALSGIAAAPAAAGAPVPGGAPPPRAAAAPAPAPAARAFDAEAATRAYLASIPAAKRSRSDAYFEGGYCLQLWGLLYWLGMLWLLLASGLSARMRDLAERWFTAPSLQASCYAVQYILASTVLVFPLTFYSEFVREHQYGLATQSFAPWVVELLEGLGLSVVIGGLLLAALYGVLRRAPRTWWIWGAVVFSVFMAILMTLGPVLIEPIFNKYTELEDPALRRPILALARANGIPSDHVYVVDASRQTTRVSANVSGLFGTTRIALNDNLLRRGTPREIEAVMGHEMGHYVLHHVPKALLVFSVMVVAGFALLHVSFGRVLARFGAGWRVRGITDPAGLPLLVALLMLYFFVLTPVSNTVVRTDEAEADLFGLNATRQADGMAEAALHLAEYRKLCPGRLEEWLFYDHPSGRTRILTAMRWKAEHLQELSCLQQSPPPAPAPR
ncbi:MAG TPA: M48 family metallopeptidase [Thermoanaerobaculia bacterium]|nr:M48 family metallopeptidase [Thermoanaerobaculia bacterium]